MRAIVTVGGGSDPYTRYLCSVCGHELNEETLVRPGVLHHPKETGGLFKTTPIQCQHAGQWFQMPTVELEPYRPPESK